MATVAEILVRIGADMSQFDKMLQNTEKGLERMGSRLQNVGKGLTLGITAPILAVGGAASKMAMDAVESENLFEVSMGNMAAAAREWSEEVSDALGMNEYEVRKNVGTFNVMLNSMGLTEDQAFSMSQALTQLAYDMASFYNLSPEEAFDKIRAGISGETEPLKRLGILLDETTSQTYAYTHGIAEQGEQLNQQQKVLARFGLLMQQTSKAQGDLARTIDSPTNRLRVMTETVRESAITLGTALMPVIQQVLGLANQGAQVLARLVQRFSELTPETQRVILVLVGLVAALGPVLTVAGTVMKLFGNIAAVFQGVTHAITFLLSPAGMMVVAIGAIVAAGVLLHKHWDEIRAWAVGVWNSITSTVTGAWEAIQSATARVWNAIKEFLAGWWTTLTMVMLGPVLGYVVIYVIQHWEEIKSKTITAWNAVRDTVSGIWNGIKSAAVALWTGIRDSVMGPVNALWSDLISIWDRIYSAVTGVWERLKSAASNLFRQVADAIVAPFKNLHIPMPHFSLGSKTVNVAGISVRVPDVSVKWYGEGGIFNSPSIIGVGEKGPEAVVPLDRLMRPSVNITITGNSIASDYDINRIGSQLVKYLRMQGVI